MKQSILCVLFVIAFLFDAASQISHDLEVYSENGLKFTLVLNGRVMNEIPASNVQVVNTNKDYVSAKIIFQDTSLPDIEKRALQIADPGEGSIKSPVSLVCKIVETRKGQQKLRFASRSHKKIQSSEIIIIESNPQPVNGKVVINW